MGDTISTLAVVSSILATFIGFPLQIFRNYAHKSCDFSLFLIVGVFISAVLWSVHASMRRDWFLFTAHIPTIFFSLVVAVQYFKYQFRKNRLKSSEMTSEQFRLWRWGRLLSH